MSEKEYTPECYREAAFERLNAAKLLHDAKRYCEAHYFSGLAVECVLRAYHIRTGRPFDEKHDLKALAKSSNFLSEIEEKDVRQVNEILSGVVTQWRNNLRYKTTKQLRKFLKDSYLDRDQGRIIKGDFLKERSRILLANASWLVHFGDQRWNL